VVLPTRAMRDAAVRDAKLAHQKCLWLPRLTRAACKPRKTPDNLRSVKGENAFYIKALNAGGEGGIRTHGTVTRTTVFETVPFDHSGTSPLQKDQ
jgi:hypothetical protein